MVVYNHNVLMLRAGSNTWLAPSSLTFLVSIISILLTYIKTETQESSNIMEIYGKITGIAVARENIHLKREG